jgi:hypothetical protein
VARGYYETFCRKYELEMADIEQFHEFMTKYHEVDTKMIKNNKVKCYININIEPEVVLNHGT